MNPNVPPPANFGQAPPANYPVANPWAGHPMMTILGGSPGTLWFASILWFVTWIAIIVVLVALARLLWRKGEEIKRR